MVRRYDNRSACIAPYSSKRQFGYSMGTEIQAVSGAVEGMKLTERCDAPPALLQKQCFSTGSDRGTGKALSQIWVVSLNSRDGTHPNSGTGARFPAVEPGMLPRSDRTAIHRWSRHNRSCLPPSPGLQVATCAANQNRVWVKPSRELRDTTQNSNPLIFRLLLGSQTQNETGD